MAEIAHQAREGYRAVRRSGFLDPLTRVGFLSKGVVYVLLGALAVMVAMREGGETTDQRGAIQFIANKPFGEVALAIIATGLLAYAFWRLVCAVSDAEGKGSDAKGLGKRAGYLFSSITHAGVAIFAIKLLTGEPTSRGDMAKAWTARFMEWPGGTLLIGLAGVAFIAAGAYQIWKGLSQKFKEKLQTSSMDATEKEWAIKAGMVGLSARGIVFGLAGVFLVFAAWKSDPSKAEGLEGVLDAVAAQPFGQWLLALLAAGLICYGLYCMVEAKYRRIPH